MPPEQRLVLPDTTTIIMHLDKVWAARYNTWISLNGRRKA